LKADPGTADVPGFFLIMNKLISNRLITVNTAIIPGVDPCSTTQVGQWIVDYIQKQSCDDCKSRKIS